MVGSSAGHASSDQQVVLVSNEIQFSLASVVADLRRNLATPSRNPGDLQRNATLWLGVRAGTQAETSSFALPAGWRPDEARFSDAAYLAALGFATSAAGGLNSPGRAAATAALLALMKRSAHTIERSGFSDDPLCAAGLVVLAKTLGLEEPAIVIARALDDAPALEPGVAVVLGCSGAKVTSAFGTDLSAGGLAAAILCDRIESPLAAVLFPTAPATSAEDRLVHGLCRGTFALGRGFDEMLILAAMELDHRAGSPVELKKEHGDGQVQRTILFLAANPGSSGRLALDEEARAIEAKLMASEHRDAIRFRSRWAVRADDLLHALNEDRPTVVHFSGHGAGVDGIVLHDDAGGDRLVSGSALRRLFSVMKDDIRIVVLSACYSSEQAQEIATVIDVVVGMGDSVADDAASVFAAAFYRALGFGRSVRNAFDQGIAAIALEGLDDTEVPELLVRAGVDPSKLVLV